MKFFISLFLFISLLSINSCSTDTAVTQESLPPESELPQVSNCAADGPGCQQFNPNL